MFARTDTTIADWTSPAVAAFQFWVSFFPVAPLFGVEWRFADWTGSIAPAGGITAARAEARASRPKKEKPALVEASRDETGSGSDDARMSRASGAGAAAVSERADDLKLIRGIGAGLEKQLNALGIRSFSQIAALSESELAELDRKLKTVKGRCFRDDWIGQARALAV